MIKRTIVAFGVASALAASPVLADQGLFRIMIPINPGVKLSAPDIEHPEAPETMSWSLLSSGLPEGEVGEEYAFDFSTLIDVTPSGSSLSNLAWSVEPLPAWLEMHAESGEISGVPLESGEVSFVVTATHQEEGSRNRGYTIVINGVEVNVLQVAVGVDNFSCAVTAEGAAVCWGDDSYYQMGGAMGGDTPSQVSGLGSGVSAITAGQDHACAIQNGAAWCWGYDDSGKLGDGSMMEAPTPVQPLGLSSGVTDISASAYTTCAVHNGAAKCWGNGSSVPVPVTGLSSGVTAISAGEGFNCAIHEGAAKCWGAGSYGKLGRGSTVSSTSPVLVTGLETGVTSISAGTDHACAVKSGAAWCWGRGQHGKLGNGGTVDSLVPSQVAGLTFGMTHIAASASHTCAVQSGSAKCWGAGGGGVLGNGSTAGTFSMPQTVTDLGSGVSHIDTTTGHTCAAHGNGLKCWGYGTSGQLGSGYANSAVPIQVVF